MGDPREGRDMSETGYSQTVLGPKPGPEVKGGRRESASGSGTCLGGPARKDSKGCLIKGVVLGESLITREYLALGFPKQETTQTRVVYLGDDYRRRQQARRDVMEG